MFAQQAALRFLNGELRQARVVHLRVVHLVPVFDPPVGVLLGRPHEVETVSLLAACVTVAPDLTDADLAYDGVAVAGKVTRPFAEVRVHCEKPQEDTSIPRAPPSGNEW